MPDFGKIIVVSGRSGAGKTTLIGFALKSMDKLKYLTTYTTRPARNGDIGYQHLELEDYLNKMKSSENWDHTEVHGNFYGADVAEAFELTRDGISLIVTSYPDLSELQNFKDKYPCEIKSIFIDISEVESAKRLRYERVSSEMARVQKETEIITPELIKSFDYQFVPIGEIQKDIVSFNKLIQDILYG
jgi:guanylate kinase